MRILYVTLNLARQIRDGLYKAHLVSARCARPRSEQVQEEAMLLPNQSSSDFVCRKGCRTACAPTGAGKTLTFWIPILMALEEGEDKMSIVVTPVSRRNATSQNFKVCR